MPVVRAAEVTRVAERLGFVLDRQRGSHAVYYRAADGARVVIPMHAGRDLKPKTLSGILNDLGVTPDEFRKLL
ncbi:MAG: type II toxin-antitoxin system HicA family toxin [Candidatus Methylomirabilota bacterium]